MRRLVFHPMKSYSMRPKNGSTAIGSGPVMDIANQVTWMSDFFEFNGEYNRSMVVKSNFLSVKDKENDVS